MKLYHKIQSIYKRDEQGQFVFGEWATDAIDYLKNLDWEWTEKVDGTNIRVGLDENSKFRIGGRTDDASIPIRLIEAIQELLPEVKFRGVFPDSDGTCCAQAKDICLYGEGYGAKIQKGGGKYNPLGQNFVLFDVKIGPWWLKSEDVRDIAKKLDILAVPIIGFGTIPEAIEYVKSGKNKSRWGEFEAEGLVLRPIVPMFARDGSRIITKVKAKDFL